MKSAFIAALALCLCGSFAAHAQPPQRFTLLNQLTGAALSNQPVTLLWDNGVRCVRAPCEANEIERLTFTTDANGRFSVARSVLAKHEQWWLTVPNMVGIHLAVPVRSRTLKLTPQPRR